MHLPQVCHADSVGSSDVRQQISALVNEVRAQPDNEVPLLRLTHLYAQLWIRTGQEDILPRILGCLRRAIALENGQYAKQVRQLLDGIGRHAAARGLTEMPATVKELVDRLEAKLAAPVSPPAPPTPAAAAEPPRSPEVSGVSPPPVVPPPSQEPAGPSLYAGEGSVAAEASEVSNETAVPEMTEEDLETEASSPPFSLVPDAEDGEVEPSVPVVGDPEEPTVSEDVSQEIETVEDARPPSGLRETALEEEEEEEEPPDRESLVRGLASVQAATVLQVEKMFREGRLNDIIRAYATTAGVRVKRRIIEGLAARLDEWRVEPLLAVGALEKDEQIFRHILRVLLHYDRIALCRQIQMENYSPDLQRVAAAVLGELGVRSALPKLGQCLENSDPFVRSMAVNGLGRAGAVAAEYVPVIVQMTRRDPNRDVRHAAAKALNTMNLKEAYEALEAATGNSRFDAEIYAELEEMRRRYGVKFGAARGEKPAKKGLSARDKAKMRNYAIFIVILAILVAVGKWYLSRAGQ